MKMTIATILLLTITLGSFSALAADGKISSILNDWFSKQETEAIDEMDASISKVQKEQTERLKTTLQEVLDQQKQELAHFLNAEKQNRAEALVAYADELIEEFKLEQSKEQELDVTELDAIMKDAVEKMDAAVENAKNQGDEDSESDADEENKTVEDAGKEDSEADQTE